MVRTLDPSPLGSPNLTKSALAEGLGECGHIGEIRRVARHELLDLTLGVEEPFVNRIPAAGTRERCWGV